MRGKSWGMGNQVQPHHKWSPRELSSSVADYSQSRQGSDWKPPVLLRQKKLAKLQRHQSAPDPTSTDSFRRIRSSNSVELLRRPRIRSVSGGSTFDAQAIANNDLRLWVLEAKQIKHINRRAKCMPRLLPAGSHQGFNTSLFVCTGSTITAIKHCLLGFLSTLHTCISPVLLVFTNFFAACLSSDPPWALPSPVSGCVKGWRSGTGNERRRPSTEDTSRCLWAIEALTFEYNFNVWE